jgi:hypothetical protein
MKAGSLFGAVSVAAVAAFAVVPPTAFADVIHACVQQPTGLVRIVSEGSACLPTETAMSWGTPGENIVSAYIGAQGAIISQDGSWISSVTYVPDGRYTLNLAAGTFAGAPRCAITRQETGNAGFVRIADPITTTTVYVEMVAATNTGFSNSAFYIVCMGSRT